MATRIEAPTEEELADAQLKIEQRHAEEEFEHNRQALEDARPKGAAKLSRVRKFGATVPPAHRGAMEFEVPGTDEPPNSGERTPAEILRAANNGQLPAPAPASTLKKKGKFDVPEIRTAATVVKSLGILYVEERKKDPLAAFQSLRDSIMSNLDILLSAMPQIKQMFELLQIGEPERDKKSGANGDGKKNRLAEKMSGMRDWLQGGSLDDED